MIAPRWIRWWFRGAALYGAAALIVSLLTSHPSPAAALSHYAFTGTAFAFQIVFWIVGGDPVRHRALMLAGVVEKLAFVLPVLLLAGRTAAVPFAAIDLALGIGFALAWRATRRLDDPPLGSSPSRIRVKLPS